MTRILVLALLATLLPVHAAPQTDRVSLSGILVRSDTGEPIANARVKIGRTDIPPQYKPPFSNILMSFWRPGTEMSTGTDDQGRFDFSGLVTGDYIVAAEADGYANRLELPGQPDRYSDYASRLTVRTSEPPESVKLSLFRFSRIGGIVRGPDGKAVPHIDVHLGFIDYSAGQREWNDRERTETNELGEYEFPVPSAGEYFSGGEYYLAVSADRYGNSTTETGGLNIPFMPTFFPSALNLESARSVSPIGSDIRANFDLQPVPTNWKTISGKVLDGVRTLSTPPNGAPPLPEVVNLFKQGATIEDLWLPDRVVKLGSNGEFQIKDVAPGIYDLYASSNQWTHSFNGHLTFEMKDRDITGLNLAFDDRSADVITGRIVDDSGKVYPSYQLSLRSRSRTLWPGDVRNDERLADRSTFRFVNVPTGIYDLYFGVPSDFYLADILQGAKSILDSGLVVGGPAPGPIEVLIRKGGGRVDIHIQGDRSRPGLVVLVPDAPGRSNRLRYHAINTTSLMLTTFENVAPGNYKVFAVEKWLYGPYQRAYFIADVLAKYEDLGVPVTIQDGQTSDVRVTMSYR